MDIVLSDEDFNENILTWWIWTAEQYKFETKATASYGNQFECLSTF